MSKKISAARAASLKVKTQSIASKLPATRNADGSVKERDKTGGKKPAPKENKPGNGQHAVTIAQAAASAVPGQKEEEKPTEAEALPPAQTIELPLTFLSAALSIAPKGDTRHYLNGVFVHQLDDKALRIVATDGHRLFVCSIAQEEETDWARAGVILPREQLERIIKYVGKKVPAIRIEYGVKHPTVKVHEIDGMAVFQFAPIAGKFPDYQRVVDSAASVFTAEREELSATTIDSKYLKAAGALSAELGSKGIIPFLAPQDAAVPSVFAFADVPQALLYVMGQRSREQALPAPTVKLFGEAAMREQLAKLEEQIAKTKANAKAAKHEKFRVQFEQKAERLELRANQLRANLSVKLPAPAGQSPAAAVPAEPAAGVAVH